MVEKTTPLGKVLQAARESKKLTLRAVENAVSISNAYLSQLESGKIRQPSPSILHKLAELYEISYSQVLELAGYPVPDQPTEHTSRNAFASRIGPVTSNEEEALIEYLSFLRSRGKGKE